jgi:K+ transporter
MLLLMNYPDAVVGISVAILILIFSVQRFGTDKVGFAFAPVILLWFAFIGGIGLYNLFKYNLGVLRAFNPMYIIHYFKRNGKQGWISLGGVFLCITGEWYGSIKSNLSLSLSLSLYIYIYIYFSTYLLVN